jgi:hypothetical protein
MGSHDPFGHLKHKLWPKKGSGIKLPIWLMIIKSQKSPQFPCIQVACNILLKKYRQGLQLCFRPHLNRRSAHKIMGPQSRKSPNFGNFGRCGHLWRGTVRGKVVVFLKSGPWWILWVQSCPWLVLAPKVLKLCINQLVVWFVQIRVND